MKANSKIHEASNESLSKNTSKPPSDKLIITAGFEQPEDDESDP